MYCQPCGRCGPDVTDALRKTLREITTAFTEHPLIAKIAACGSVKAENGWDINELAYTSPDYQAGYQTLPSSSEGLVRLRIRQYATIHQCSKPEMRDQRRTSQDRTVTVQMDVDRKSSPKA